MKQYLRHPWKFLKSAAKYKTAKLNSLYEPRTDSVLEVQDGYHIVDITTGFIVQPKEEKNG